MNQDNNNNIGIIKSDIVSQPMFSYLIPENNNPGTFNPEQLRDISQRALPQANLIKVDGVTMPSTEIKDYDSSDKPGGGDIQANYPPVLASKEGEQRYTSYALTNKGSPQTWYHVEEDGSTIKVSENVPEELEMTSDCATPLLDERPTSTEPPSISTTITDTPIKCTDNRSNETMPIANTTETGTSMDSPPMTNSTCSPIRPNTKDTGTDPINWWLEETRRQLYQ
jgi:hypothetical protein